jgi:hypothetical protein
MKKRLSLIVYFLFTFIIIFISVEIFSRFVFPISIGVKIVDEKKTLIKNQYFNNKNSTYYQYHPEYFVLTNIDSDGNRIVPSSVNSNKLIIFVGDSHMFGQGVDDFNTIPNLVCKKIVTKCINLSVPGTGTVFQGYLLEAFTKKKLNNKFKDIKVVHLYVASTMYNHSGNDLTDNITEYEYFQKVVLMQNKESNLEIANEKNLSILEDNYFELPKMSDKFWQKPYEQIKKKLYVNALDEIESDREYSFLPRNIILSTLKFFYINTNIARIFGNFYGLDLRASIYSKYPTYVNENQLNLINKAIKKIMLTLKNKKIDYIPILHSTYPEVKNGWNITTHKKLSPMFETLYMPDYDLVKLKKLYHKDDGHNNDLGNEKIANFIIKILSENP